MKSKLKLIVILAAVLVLSGCQQNLSNSKRVSDSKGVMSQNQNVTVVEQTRLSTVDISKVNSFNKLRSSTEGLFRLGKNGRVNPGLAQSYRISKNAKTYTFKLRKNARWSNGQPITQPILSTHGDAALNRRLAPSTRIYLTASKTLIRSEREHCQ